MTAAHADLPPLRTLSLHDLDDLALPDVEWVVDDLLPAGALALLLGRPKVGKSLLAIDLLACVARGEPFLERPTRPGPTLYVPAEDSPAVLRQRLRARLGDDRDLPLVVLPADGTLDQAVHLDDVASFRRLARTIVDLRPRVVVLDPFREFHRLDENDADTMAALLRPLRQLARGTGTLLVLVHHRGKRGTDASLAARGSTAITGAVDLVLAFDPLPESSEDDGGDIHTLATALTLRVEGRYGPRRRFQVRLGPDLRWQVLALSRAADLPVRERVRRCVESSSQPLTAGQVLRACGGARSNVQDALRRLVRSGRLARDGAGTPTDPFRYCPAAPPPGPASNGSATGIDDASRNM